MFDWVTWSIWSLGLVILVIWIIFPLKEFAGILKAQHEAHKKSANSGGEERPEGEAPRDA